MRSIEVSADEVARVTTGEGTPAPTVASPSKQKRAEEPAPVSTPAEPVATLTTGARSGGSSDVYNLPSAGVDLERLERELVLQALAASKGNKTRAGRLLGLNRDQVRYRLEKYGLQGATNGSHTEKE